MRAVQTTWQCDICDGEVIEKTTRSPTWADKPRGWMRIRIMDIKDDTPWASAYVVCDGCVESTGLSKIAAAVETAMAAQQTDSDDAR